LAACAPDGARWSAAITSVLAIALVSAILVTIAIWGLASVP